MRRRGLRVRGATRDERECRFQDIVHGRPRGPVELVLGLGTVATSVMTGLADIPPGIRVQGLGAVAIDGLLQRQQFGGHPVLGAGAGEAEGLTVVGKTLVSAGGLLQRDGVVERGQEEAQQNQDENGVPESEDHAHNAGTQVRLVEHPREDK